MSSASKPPSRWLGRIVVISILAGVSLLLARAFRPTAMLVETGEVRRGLLQVTVDEDGRTRVRDPYVVSAPVDGRLERVALEPGDRVESGRTLVAEFSRTAPHLLDARGLAEARARVGRAEAALEQARARAEESTAALELARSEQGRQAELFGQGLASEQAVERAEDDLRRAHSTAKDAELAVRVAEYELELAGAGLVEDTPDETGLASGRIALSSPVDGVVLRVFEESSRPLAAGTPILEVGNLDQLEVVADYLTEEAVRIRPGMVAWIGDWGEARTHESSGELRGRVRRVEPGGYTKVSALGVEEQRVDVVVDLPPRSDPAGGAASRLGDGYRTRVRIVLHEAGDVVLVPTGALFRSEGAFAAFVVADGIARRREVTVGEIAGLEAEVTSGLEPGERVVLYPSELIRDGLRVTGPGRNES